MGVSSLLGVSGDSSAQGLPRGVYNSALLLELCFLLLSLYITHSFYSAFSNQYWITFFTPIDLHNFHSYTMNMFSFLLTLGITLAGVHSIPAPFKVSSEITSASNHLVAARALPSGDQYPPQPPGAGPGKRGLLYDSKSKVDWSNFYYESPYVTYASNGDVMRGDEINTWFSYVPTIAVRTFPSNI